ncbi:MAG: tRNA dihydrouridine synthase DusB [Oscillospiraceae bacterium]|jgi:nifR3 family TIM-barrel protein|nr:tRNA dihydrouridine synthase DusB [Oscillospiraceae bacterium]
MKIGTVKIKGKAVLAPMAGVADRAFRELCRSYGAAYCVGEMVSAKGVSMHDRKSKELMFLSDAERPSAIQIFGSTSDVMAFAAKAAMAYSPEIIDINMGCPAPKISRGGSGAALMRDPALAGEIIKAVVEAVSVPVSVKIRKGWDDDQINAVELAQIAEQNGAAAITVHGRTRAQMYAPPVDLSIIRAVKQAVSIPVIGNGDITSPESARQMLHETGCDLVMVGRGALGKPWLFSQINQYLDNGSYAEAPPVEERMAVMLRHIKTICAYRGETTGMNEARKHALWYTKGIRGSANYRSRLSLIKTKEEIKDIANEIIAATKDTARTNF